MDAQQFLAEFGHIAKAPGGVVRLRELVLSLAVSGRLFENFVDNQKSLDGYLASIGAELSAYKVAHNYRRKVEGDQFARQRERENGSKGIAIRLGQIGVLIRGVSYDKAVSRSSLSEGLVGLLRANNIGSNVSFDDQVFVPSELVGEEQFLQPGDILIAMSSGSKDLVGKAALVTETHGCTFGAFCGVFRSMPSVRSDFIRLVMQAPSYRSAVADQGKGIGIHNLTKGHIENFEFILPSPHQQTRIVSKVDELMALCDQLEKQQQDRRRLQNAARQSTLQALANAESPHELQEGWQRLQANFGRLFSESSDTNSLKALLLKLAMRGLLVNQEAGDTHPNALLQQVANEKAQLTAAKKLKAGTTIPAPSEVELPYELPKGWTWARVVDLVEVGTGATPAKSEPTYYGGDIPWYTSSATNEQFARKPETFITEKALVETNCKVFPAGSLIVAMYGQGKTRGQVSEMLVAGATNQAVAALVFFESSKRVKRFLKYYFEKIYDEIRLQAEGGPQPNLSVGKIKEILVPVPPLEEQERIVAQLDELIEQCNDWGAQLKQRDVVASQLAALAVTEITAIANEGYEDAAATFSQTELIA